MVHIQDKQMTASIGLLVNVCCLINLMKKGETNGQFHANND